MNVRSQGFSGYPGRQGSSRGRAQAGGSEFGTDYYLPVQAFPGTPGAKVREPQKTVFNRTLILVCRAIEETTVLLDFPETKVVTDYQVCKDGRERRARMVKLVLW